METKTKKTKAAFKTVNTIFETKDYSIFKYLPGNRNHIKPHLERLKKSFKENYLISPITVNNNFEIIDGQHRFEAAKALNLPIRFFIAKNYGLKEVHKLNTLSKLWTSDDYIKSYIELNFKEYARLKKFKDKYNLGYKAVFSICAGTHSGPFYDDFKNGLFEFKDYFKACLLAEYINTIRLIYPNAHRNTFVTCIISIFDKPGFNKDRLIRKIKLQPTKLTDCTTSENYKTVLEEIYNYKTKNKFNLRY